MSIGNGYEDIGEVYADMKEVEREERAARLAMRQPEFDEIIAAGHTAKKFNNGTHWKIGEMNFWPSTGRWNNAKSRMNGRLADEKHVLSLLVPKRASITR